MKPILTLITILLFTGCDYLPNALTYDPVRIACQNDERCWDASLRKCYDCDWGDRMEEEEKSECDKRQCDWSEIFQNCECQF